MIINRDTTSEHRDERARFHRHDRPRARLSDYKGKWVALFSHPGDFTPGCTTEFIAFSRVQPQFAARNAALLGLSIDSNPSHLAWLSAIYRSTCAQVPVPVFAGQDRSIARLYGIIASQASTRETVRNVFFIGPEQPGPQSLECRDWFLCYRRPPGGAVRSRLGSRRKQEKATGRRVCGFFVGQAGRKSPVMP